MTDAHLPNVPLGGDDPFTPDELAALYAAGALSTDESAAFESRVRAGEEAFVSALRNVMPALHALQNAPSEAPPPPHVLDVLLSRIDAEAPPRRATHDDAAHDHDEHSTFADEMEAGEPLLAGAPAADRAASLAGIAVLRGSSARWRRTGLPGVRIRTLLADRRSNRRTIMLDMAPGAALPDHHHAGIEEVFMVSGDLSIAGTTLHAGDYIRIDEGAEHGVPVTPSGCVCIVISNYVPFPLTSLLGFAWTALKSLFKRGRPKA